MRIITLNVNGIRSAVQKGLFQWLGQQQADVICLQEIRAPEALLQTSAYTLPGYTAYYKPAHKKGYSGVGILTRHVPDKVVDTAGFSGCDEEGRYLHIEIGSLTIASVYLPSGTSGDARQTVKYAFMEAFYERLRDHLHSKRSFIFCGDWNIAHKPIDLKNWRANQTHTGFLPEERAWLDQVFSEGYIDAFRALNPHPDEYTWWSHRGASWERNIGWRIDYQIITPDLAPTLLNTHIYKSERFSDHAPLIVDYRLVLP